MLFGCQEKTIDPKQIYNDQANGLIRQIILSQPCHCVLEMPSESVISLSLAENRIFDVRKEAVESLQITPSELDSMEKLGAHFSLDTHFLKRNNIKLIQRKGLREKITSGLLFKSCKKGYFYLSKPIFNKTYTIAFVSWGFGPSCTGLAPFVYENKLGFWTLKK
ncbi:MAG: hypothetical protein CFE24_13040 [Flavobacterium sp. BFFFF2]|nr:MAG: hypothetical protein CFE24_13040 [Flavobacterium sp. BFFFF2]